MILGFGFYLLLYSLRAMGAGDVKLMAAVGAMVGPGHWLLIFMASAVAGGVLALLCVLWKGRLKTTLWNTFFLWNIFLLNFLFLWNIFFLRNIFI